MKIKGNCFVKITGLAAFGGLILSPLAAIAQDQGDRPPEFRPERPATPGGEMNGKLIKNARVRLQHLREAGMHLNAAGCEEMANDVRRQISQMETRLKNQSKPQPQGEFQQRKEAKPNAAPSFGGRRFGAPGADGQNAAPFRGGFHHGMSPDAERPNFRMGPKTDGAAPDAAPKPTGAPDANAAILSEIRKLRQEMGELRSQVRRMQANAAQGKESKIREDRPNAKERPDHRPNARPERPDPKNRPDQRPNAPMPPPGPPSDRPQ